MRHNERVAAKEVTGRMDKEDRAAYIKQAKAKLNLEGINLKSSKRLIHDQQKHTNMPYLEFDGFYPNIHCSDFLQPQNMQWSIGQFNTEAARAKREQGILKYAQDYEKDVKEMEKLAEKIQ